MINPKLIEFSPDDLQFDNKVREACKSCKRYGIKATCPPYVADVDYYEKTLTSYKKGIIVVMQFKIDNSDEWRLSGHNSTVELNNYVLNYRNRLISEGNYFCVAFGGGSCKNCETCTIPCPNPYKSLIPVEATGINVVKTLKRVAKLQIKFPVKNTFYRIGLILYDKA